MADPDSTTPDVADVQDQKDTTASKLTKQEQEQADKADELRKKMAAVHAQVRAAEYTKTVSAFTYDHYIDEQKRKLKGEGRKIRDAGGNVIDGRSSSLEQLSKLETDFNSALSEATKLAQSGDTTDKTGGQ